MDFLNRYKISPNVEAFSTERDAVLPYYVVQPHQVRFLVGLHGPRVAVPVLFVCHAIRYVSRAESLKNLGHGQWSLFRAVLVDLSVRTALLVYISTVMLAFFPASSAVFTAFIGS